MVVAGNLISFVACVMMIIIGFLKKKEQILMAQCGQFSIQAFGNLALGSVSGCISCVIAVIRILVFQRVKVTVWLKLGFLALQAGLTAWSGAQTVIEWIPFFSMVAYTWYLDTDNAVVFKLANLVGVVMWAVHDLHYMNYVSFTFDIMTFVSTVIGIFMILRDGKKPAAEEQETANKN